MFQLIHNFAATEEVAENDSLFGALGIDWKVLLLQMVAFVILVWLLKKYVYPPLIRAIDEREKAIAESVSAAQEAEEKADEAQQKIEAQLKEARTEAATIVDTAHKEASAMVKEAEDKAKKRAEQIVNDARSQLEVEVTKARKALRDETTELVALATEKVVREKVDTSRDRVLIESALKEAQ